MTDLTQKGQPVPDLLTARESTLAQHRVAGALADMGLVEGDRLVLSVPGSADYVTVVLGATRSGIVPVPLDPRLTTYERDAIVRDVAPAHIVDHPAQLITLLHGPTAELDPWPRCRPMHFTSGTSGRPKGVWSGMFPSDHAEASVREERDLWRFVADDVHLVVSPTYHSAPLRFAAGTLLAGGSIAVLPGFDPEALVETLSTVRPTSLFCVPAHLQRLLAWLDERDSPIDTSSLRLVAHAGAPCPEPIRLRTHELFGEQIVWEFYGSTEGQFTACSAPEWHSHPGTLGLARPGRSLSVDADGQLWCGVPEWARFTYWNDPGKTARAWRDSPAGPIFTVGDLGRIDAEGYVYLDDRREDLIISGGVNVYPSEVEAALVGVPGLIEIAVFGRDDELWGQRVCAAYVGDVEEQLLRDVAETRLAPPKRPKTYEQFSELPRTATGKVRRTEL